VIQATVLVVEDEPTLREALCDSLDLAGYTVTAADNGLEAIRLLSEAVDGSGIGMVISDVQMKPMDGYALLRHIRSSRPEIPVLMMTAYGTIQQAVQSMQAGAVDYLVKPFDAKKLVETVGRHLAQPVCAPDDMVAVAAESQYVASLARRVAATDATILITGESGVGKEVLARYIHRHSPRAPHPFVAINCAAIPDNMLEATLFGYEKGAFTGAISASPGKFEQAQCGTLLLDEISEMELGLQAKLLRVLQEREVERLGGRKLIPLDVRILATSNRNLRDEVSAGRFREDLFYRLNVFPLRLPPLRERSGDILPLARRMLAHGARAQGRALPEFSAVAEQRLLGHAWPGNVRELDNVVQRVLIMQAGAVIDGPDLQIEGESGVTSVPAEPHAAALGDDLRSREQQLILDTLRSVRGSRRSAADRLGISERTLRYKLARLRRSGVELPD